MIGVALDRSPRPTAARLTGRLWDFFVSASTAGDARYGREADAAVAGGR
ncbi:hypothetical protein [Actinocorallia longicatena]